MVKSEKSTFAKFMRKMSPSPSDFLFNQFFFSILGKTIDLFMMQITHCQNCTIDDEAQEESENANGEIAVSYPIKNDG